MFKIKRWMMIRWAEGEIMERNEDSCIVVDELACEEAERRLNIGETIGLMDNNYNVVSTLSLTDEGYVEKKHD